MYWYNYMRLLHEESSVTTFLFDFMNSAPATNLIENGWDLPAEFKEEYLEAGSNYVINLVKGSQTIEVNVKNEEDSHQKIRLTEDVKYSIIV